MAIIDGIKIDPVDLPGISTYAVEHYTSKSVFQNLKERFNRWWMTPYIKSHGSLWKVCCIDGLNGIGNGCTDHSFHESLEEAVDAAKTLIAMDIGYRLYPFPYEPARIYENRLLKLKIKNASYTRWAKNIPFDEKIPLPQANAN